MKASEWAKERKQWFKDHPRDWYVCHYCSLSLHQNQTTLDHTNNRKHKGDIVPCCVWCNTEKGSISHDRYVEKRHPNHECNLGEI